MSRLEFQLWRADVPSEREAWEQLHAAWPRREVFAHPAYVRLFAGDADSVLAAFARTPQGWILYPFIARPIAPGRCDLTSAYGYGGAFYTGDGAAAADAFWARFAEWAHSAGAVSEFVRFSLFEDQQLPYPGEREARLVNVVRSLDADEAAIWAEFDHKVRKNVNKARRSGITVEVDPDGARLDDFYRIYVGTMDRREARRGYYFPRTFFEDVAAKLAGQFAYFHAVLGGEVVSTELALVSAESVYSFLGGTDASAFEARPNDLLKHELILWAKRAGKRQFVLGGGYSADDGIFRYKRAFAPSGLMPFHIGRRIFDPAAYEDLVTERTAAARTKVADWSPDPGFFPAYRAPLPTG